MASPPQHGRCLRATLLATAAGSVAKFTPTALSSAFTAATGGLSASGSTALRGSRGAAAAAAATEGFSAQPAPVALGAAGAGLLGALAWAGVRKRRSVAVARRVTPEEWNGRVRRIEGDRAVFDVEIPKPLGLVPRDFPNRAGVGVATIKPEGNTAKVNEGVLVNGQPGMFVMEGDEVVAVNGVSVEGKPLSEVGPLVKGAQGDTIKLTLVRYTSKGPVKVVFLPEGSMVTMRRGTEIQQAGKNCGAGIAYSCHEGWCKACWMTLDAFPDSVYKACDVSKSAQRPAPPHPRLVPEDWDSALPFALVNWAETMKRKRKAQKALAAEKGAQTDPDQMAMA